MGSRLRGIGVVAAGLAVVACACAPTASADRELTATVRQDGHRVMFDISRGAAGLTVLDVTRRSFSSASYLHLGSRTTVPKGGSIDADLGHQGLVDAKFVPRKLVERPGDDCSRTVTRRGYLIGKIVLKGVPGVEPVRARRIKAQLTSYGKPCLQPVRANQREVVLSACNRTTDIGYGASIPANDSDVGSIHFATRAVQPSKRLVVFQTVTQVDELGAFAYSPDLLGATVQPGKPYSGSATFSDGKLMGDLEVQFIGERRPLAIAPGPALLKKSRSRSQSIELEPPCRMAGGGTIGIVGWSSPAGDLSEQVARLAGT